MSPSVGKTTPTCLPARFQLETRYLLSMFKRATQTLMMALVSGPVGVL
jgi:hypothetical protein